MKYQKIIKVSKKSQQSNSENDKEIPKKIPKKKDIYLQKKEKKNVDNLDINIIA